MIGRNFFNPNGYITSLDTSIKVNRYKGNIHFGQTYPQDSYQNSSLAYLFDEKTIKSLIKQNPEIKKILSKNKIPYSLNLKELKELKENHCKNTAEICAKIVKNLPPALKQQVNLKDLKDGALIHDIGKVLIPSDILNKNGPLNPDERKIMTLHSELGYQLLKNTNVNEEVLNLVKYHHTPNKINKNKSLPDINLQVLNLADKYSALTEKRTYKDEFSPRKALTILYNEVKEGKVDPFVFNALVKTTQQEISPLIIKKC